MVKAFCLIAFSVISCFPAIGTQPNVLMLVADDLGWGDLSANGNKTAQTPNLDSLAKSGLNFEKFYVCPNGSTTSASLLTGRYHYRTGAVGEAAREATMYASEKTLGEIFGENGYRTGYFGQWYHGENWPHNARGQGFDRVAKMEKPAKEFISENDDQPFFCLIKIPEPKLADYKSHSREVRLEKVVEGISRLDKFVGDLIGHLRDSGQSENTVVIFLSDNGPDFFGETEGRYNGYFYGGKGSVHEGGVRVPCFVTWPGKIEAGAGFSRMATHIDWYPTLVDLCGLQSKGRQLRVDGTSLATVLLGKWSEKQWPNRILFTSWTPPGYDVKQASVAVRSDRWVALRDPRWRRKEAEWELYDLKTDPFQSHEQSEKYPFLLSELKADLGFWIDHTTDDGVGPISTHVGHPDWPTVTLRANPKMTWPIKVIRPGDYLIKFEGASKAEVKIGGNVMKLNDGSRIQLSEDTKSLSVLSGGPKVLLLTHEK